jgi:hypothetical protein
MPRTPVHWQAAMKRELFQGGCFDFRKEWPTISFDLRRLYGHGII